MIQAIPLTFTDENVSRLFGKEAAEDEDFDRLQSYYIKSRTHEKLTSNLPLRILVGHKGIGKSAIFTIARHEDTEAHRVSILIRPDDIASIGKNEDDFDQMIRDWKIGLVTIVSNKISECIHDLLPTDEKTRNAAILEFYLFAQHMRTTIKGEEYRHKGYSVGFNQLPTYEFVKV